MGEVSRGAVDESLNITAVQIVPPLMQLYPDIEVAHADEASLMSTCAAADIGTCHNKFTWLFAGRTLYLLVLRGENCGGADEEDDGYNDTPFSSRMRVLHSRDVAPLLNAYLSSTKNSTRDVGPLLNAYLSSTKNSI